MENKTLNGGQDDTSRKDLILGLSIFVVIVSVAFIWSCVYSFRRRARNLRDREKVIEETMEMKNTEISSRPIRDPLEKKPYTQVTFPVSKKSKDRSKYGVCQYRNKGEITVPLVFTKMPLMWKGEGNMPDLDLRKNSSNSL